MDQGLLRQHEADQVRLVPTAHGAVVGGWTITLATAEGAAPSASDARHYR